MHRKGAHASERAEAFALGGLAKNRRLPERGTVLAFGKVTPMLIWMLNCVLLSLVALVVSFSEAPGRGRWLMRSLGVLFLILFLVHALVS